MDIYLVRVRQRADQSLYLERKPNATTDDDYIAISHVWGTPDTVKETVLDGHPGVVKLSPGKRDILSILSRPDVCGSSWLWMDLFCIDQTESATISIADQLMSIPHVYKSSRCVKVLLEHPICADWHAAAMDVVNSNNRDPARLEADLHGKELDHSNICGPHMVCFDPWFQRLWTRQEGLYGKVLDIVPLNLIQCPRKEILFDTDDKIWNAGQFAAKKSVAFGFLTDKLAYHGIDREEASKAYVDFVFQRSIDMAKYGGGVGPVATYPPFYSVSDCRRATTKLRDYVLAVFPDIIGYIPPPDMRMMTFPELVVNALSQAPIKQTYFIVPKVPSGMMMKDSATTSLTESIAPWIPEKPDNVSDAYDSFTILPLTFSPIMSTVAEELYCACRQVTVEDIQLGFGELPRTLELMETMHYDKQRSIGRVSDPLMGMSRDQFLTERGRVQKYLYRHILSSQSMLEVPKMDRMVLDFVDAVENVPQAIFVEEHRRFLISLICGTSLTTSDVIVQHARPCVLLTPFGKLLATLRLEEGEAQRPQELQLLCSPLVAYHGFLVTSKTTTGATTVIGRTVIPSEAFWEAVADKFESFPKVSG